MKTKDFQKAIIKEIKKFPYQKVGNVYYFPQSHGKYQVGEFDVIGQGKDKFCSIHSRFNQINQKVMDCIGTPFAISPATMKCNAYSSNFEFMIESFAEMLNNLHWNEEEAAEEINTEKI